MRAFLMIVLCAASAAAQNAQQQAQASVAQTVAAALPPNASVPQGGDMSRFLRTLPPDQRQSALTALASSGDSFPRDPATQAVLAGSYMDLGDADSARLAAERALAADPRNGDALAVKARALQALHDVQGALAAYRAIPPSSPQYSVAVAQIKLLGQGGPGASPAASGTGDGGMVTTGDRTLDRRMASAFSRGSQSGTFNDTVRRFDPSAVTLADLQRAGIGIEMGPADMKTSVQVVERDGQQVIQFSPSVVNNTHPDRVAAQLGRGIEEARTNRDDNWLTAWIRSLGGRVVAVKVLKDLNPADRQPAPTNVSDQELMRDARMAQRPANFDPGESYDVPNGPGNSSQTDAAMQLTRATTAATPDTADVLLKFTRTLYGIIQQPTSQDNAYISDLKNRGL